VIDTYRQPSRVFGRSRVHGARHRRTSACCSPARRRRSAWADRNPALHW